MSTCIATPLRGPVSMRVPFTPASAGEVRHALEAWLDTHDVADGVVEDARLVVTELVGNAIRHASPLANGSILVRWRLDDGLLVVTVCDGGGETIPERIEPRADAVSGRGLAIVDALSRTWWIERTAQMRAVHVRLALA